MTITCTIEGLDSVKAAFDPKVMMAAAYRAINRSVDGAVTDISKEVRATYNVKKADIDKRIKKQYCPDYNTLEGSITVVAEEKSALPLILFSAVERRNLLGGGSIKVKKGKQGFISQKMKNKTLVQGVAYKVLLTGGKGFSVNAFIIPGAKGSLQIVRRLPGAKGRFDLKEKRVITPAAMVGSLKHGVLDRIKTSVQARLNSNFNKELQYYQSRFAAGKSISGIGRQP